MDADDCLNILEQRPNWARVSTNIAWCFQRPETTDISALVGTLQHAFEDLTAAFPWVGGRVINEGCDPARNNTGVFKIKPRDVPPRIIVKDHRQTPSVPDMNILRQAGFAIRSLDEAFFAPRNTHSLVSKDVGPVLLIQANVISGGLVVVFSGNHSAMDMSGFAQVIRWFDKQCHGGSFTPTELEVGNMPRRDLIPLLDPTYQPGDEVLQQIPLVKTTAMAPNAPANAKQRLQAHWRTFLFQSTSVADLKNLATSTRTSAYVSTDDTLSAFIWQSLARVRLDRLGPGTLSTVARACNARRLLDIPSTYPGLVQNTIYSKLPLRELADLPLGVVASTLRDAVTSEAPSVGHTTRAIATVLSRLADKGCLKIAARMDQSSDLLLTSHMGIGAYELDFRSGLGPAEAVRLTHLIEYEGLVYLLPATLSGDVAVTICLRDDDLALLEADGSFTQFCRYSG
jgi:hypothetical protein